MKICSLKLFDIWIKKELCNFQLKQQGVFNEVILEGQILSLLTLINFH